MLSVLAETPNVRTNCGDGQLLSTMPPRGRNHPLPTGCLTDTSRLGIPRPQTGPAGRRRTTAPPIRIDCPTEGNARLHTSVTSNGRFWIGRGWIGRGVARRKTALSRPAAFSVSIPTGSKGFLCAGTHGAQRRVPVIPVRAHHAPEALQRRVSLMLVMRTQVQPVSLQTRSSPAPGAP
jgi:hypothetical protein